MCLIQTDFKLMLSLLGSAIDINSSDLSGVEDTGSDDDMMEEKEG